MKELRLNKYHGLYIGSHLDAPKWKVRYTSPPGLLGVEQPNNTKLAFVSLLEPTIIRDTGE